VNETALMRQIRAACNALPGVRLWRNNVGGAKTDARGWVAYGLGEGSADLVGVCRVAVYAGDGVASTLVGRLFALEVKTAKGVVSDAQRAWAQCVRDLGGFCVTVRSVDEAIAAVERCRRGERE
jgi:hypothetical protein